MKYKITAPSNDFFEWLVRFCEARPITIFGIEPTNILIVEGIQRFELDMLKNNSYEVEEYK